VTEGSIVTGEEGSSDVFGRAAEGGAVAGVPEPNTEANGAVIGAPGPNIEASGAVIGAQSSLVGLVLVLVIWAYVVARTVVQTTDSDLRLWYAVGFGIFLAVQLVVLLRRDLSTGLLHLLFMAQSAIVLSLFTLEPERDFVPLLFVALCYQAATVFTARTRLVWVSALVALTGASLVTQLGPLRGLSLALVPMAAGVVLATYVVVRRELEAARVASQRMVGDLQAAHRQLEIYAGQADELAAIEARSRVARELEESVSRTLSDVLAVARSTQRLRDKPDEAGPELERLQALTQQALAQMRRIIAELRPAPADAAEEP
jgi:signal transduction histidine kinase